MSPGRSNQVQKSITGCAREKPIIIRMVSMLFLASGVIQFIGPLESGGVNCFQLNESWGGIGGGGKGRRRRRKKREGEREEEGEEGREEEEEEGEEEGEREEEGGGRGERREERGKEENRGGGERGRERRGYTMTIIKSDKLHCNSKEFLSFTFPSL